MIRVPKELIKKLEPKLKDAEISLDDLVIELLEDWMVPSFNCIEMRLNDGYVLSIEKDQFIDKDTLAYVRKSYPKASIYHCFQPKVLSPEEQEHVLSVLVAADTLLTDITQAVKAVRPEVIISVSPNPPGFAYRKYLQDWVQWVNLGIVDEVVVQLYRDDLNIFENDLYNSGFHNLRTQVPIAIGLYTGPLTAAKDFGRTVDELAAVQQAGYGGVSFFSWETTFWGQARKIELMQFFRD